MPSEQRYEAVPPIPSYDEAVGGGSSWQRSDTIGGRSPIDERTRGEIETQTLLRSGQPSSSSQRTSGGVYHHPTVETDDEESDILSALDSDSDTSEHAGGGAGRRRRGRRVAMEELEVEDPLAGDGDGSSTRSSIWRKRMAGLSLLSLPRWARRWRLPERPRLRIPPIRLGRDPEGRSAAAAAEEGAGGGSGGGSGEGRDGVFARIRRAWYRGGPAEDEEASNSGGRRWNSTMLFLIFARALAVFIVMGFVYLLFVSDVFAGLSRKMSGAGMFDPEAVRIFVQEQVDVRRIRETSRHFSSYAHVAGTEGDYALAIDTRNAFADAGLEQITVDEFYVYLNYPVAGGRVVQILERSSGDPSAQKPIWTADLEELDVGVETAGHEPFVFHGLSRSGEVVAPLVYARYGSEADFARLRTLGVETEGTIALVRYYGDPSDRAAKVRNAERAGCVGALIYSDPADDGFLRGPVAPGGRFMPADGVQRGSVALTSYVVGDVLTPGWESTKGMPRMTTKDNPGLVNIPSLPLAWRDAKVLLQHIKGFGARVPEGDGGQSVQHDGDHHSLGWVGGVPDVGEWWTGNLSGPVVRLRNVNDEVEQQPIWNVYGKIPGVEQPHHPVIIGAHRDAWSFGASDPGSGTSVMLELVHVFGSLMEHGWRPLRPIEFMSWDAEEYNLIGSTEFVEKNTDLLRDNALAYINLDSVVEGDSLRASGSPVFRRMLLRSLDRVADGNFNTTLRDLWDRRGGQLDALGAGSDYVAFQDIAGTSSLDLSFQPGDGKPGYPYHSSYDNFDWMDRVGDPGFGYHGMVAQVVALLVLELSDRPVLPFDMPAYADALARWVAELEAWTGQRGKEEGDKGFQGYAPLKTAVEVVAAAVREFVQWEVRWETTVLGNNHWEGLGLGRERAEYNKRMGMFETNLLDLELGGGIPNRTQYKHILYGPALASGYDGVTFPAIRDAVVAANWTLANELVAKSARLLEQAAGALVA